MGGGLPLLAAPAYAYGLRDVVTRSRSNRSALQPLSRNRPRLTLGAYCSQTENSVARSLANNIRFGLHVIARSKATKQSIAGSSSTPSNGHSIAAPVTPWATNAHGSRAKLASLLHDRSTHVSLSLQPQLYAWGFKLTWPRPSADECSLDDLSSSAFGHFRRLFV